MKLVLKSILLASVLIACKAQNNKPDSEKRSLSEIIEINKYKKNKLSVLIDKSDYKLYIRVDSAIVKEYPVVFGKNVTDDKLMQGDYCTPEGKFKIIPNSSIENQLTNRLTKSNHSVIPE